MNILSTTNLHWPSERSSFEKDYPLEEFTNPQQTSHKFLTNFNGAKVITTCLQNSATVRCVKEGSFHLISEKDIDKLHKTYSSSLYHRSDIFKNLNYTNIWISTHMAKVLSKLLTMSSFTVEILTIKHCFFEKGSIRYIAQGLTKSFRLRELAISECHLTLKDINHISKSVGYLKYLEKLNLSSNSISPDLIENLLKELRHSKVNEINLSGNFSKSNLARHLSEILKSNRDITKLNLSRNSLKGTGADFLATSLIFNHTLTQVNLESNEIGPQGCQRLCLCLERNYGVTHLNLNQNRIGDQGMTSVCALLKANKILKHISLEINNITSESGRAIESMLRINKTLTNLNLNNNRLANNGARFIASGLEANETLRNLYINDNEIGIRGIQEILNSIINHPILELLSLNQHNSAFEPPEANRNLLVNDLVRNENLKVLNIDYNYEGWESKYSLVQSILTRNFITQQNQIRSSLLILKISRILFFKRKPITPANEPLLPRDIFYQILLSYDPQRNLSIEQFQKILKFALNPQTLSCEQTKVEFLKFVFGNKFID
ncbi:RNI-like protein [Conidiobolus coronatus NRRL 28638]|uniref:RNI-like protein n=1 Tax=Conidiobolus coronatus (strain ATCC 28846 / CBS 209.66 / NRRL 28638) TaxID=796925 RepID=A0A137PB37_CONC2|nr:RNI-like protein [Conidiobolus coronatus NRRL 28638]|eukprot:KXN72230.1 RNI-like protein [Conidiobolus coronatus NRRL 28638]